MQELYATRLGSVLQRSDDFLAAQTEVGQSGVRAEDAGASARRPRSRSPFRAAPTPTDAAPTTNPKSAVPEPRWERNPALPPDAAQAKAGAA